MRAIMPFGGIDGGAETVDGGKYLGGNSDLGKYLKPDIIGGGGHLPPDNLHSDKKEKDKPQDESHNMGGNKKTGSNRTAQFALIAAVGAGFWYFSR